MSGATWIAAERSSSWSWWSRWRARRRADRSRAVAPDSQAPLALIASFDDVAALRRATSELRAAAFTSEEFADFRRTQPEEQAPASAGMRRWLLAGPQPRSREEREAIAVPSLLRRHVERWLALGGGVLIVASVHRLYEACRIIEQAGGRIGVG